MPQLRTVPSLQELCISYVSSNIDNWCKKNDRLNLTLDDNPVSCLPNVILNDICTHAMKDKNLRPHHLNTLINEYTTNVDFSHRVSFSGNKSPFFDHGIALIRNICTNLTSLNLCKTLVSETDLAELAKTLHSIENLNLKSTLTNDTVLRNLGNNSPNLRELNVKECSITDDGIKSLCVRNCGPARYWPGGKCRLIEKLQIDKSKLTITKKGIKTMILNLPFLHDIDYDNTLRIFEEIYAKNRVRQFQLQNINFKFDYEKDITDKTLVAAASLCPNVVKVKFLLEVDSIVSWLPAIAEFRQLEDLCIVQGTGTFDSILQYRQVAPTLTLIGSHLKSLTLSATSDVNLCDIGVNCPLLTTLELCFVSFDSSVIPSATKNSKCIFAELRELAIYCMIFQQVPVDHLQALLSNCVHVQDLCLYGCRAITDDLLLRVFQCNLFTELHTLDIQNCGKICLSTILFIITNFKCLKDLTCYCAGIEDSERVELTELARKENIKFTLSYYNHIALFD